MLRIVKKFNTMKNFCPKIGQGQSMINIKINFVLFFTCSAEKLFSVFFMYLGSVTFDILHTHFGKKM